jgi:GNAT superfamily N-acetyltransferase
MSQRALSGTQFGDVTVDGDVARVQRGDYHVMVMKHAGDYGTAAYASHRPEGGEGSTVGEAHFLPDGTLDNIGISPAHQRKGVGTMIVHAAHALAQAGVIPPIKSSGERTDAGEAFARKVSGGADLPTRKRVFRN